MAFNTANTLIKASEVLAWIDSCTDSMIRSKISWTASNAPSTTKSKFDSINLVSASTSTDVVGEGRAVTAADMYVVFERVFSSWTRVRRVHILGYTGNNNNGGAVTYSLSYNQTAYGYVKTTSATSLLDRTAITSNTLITGSPLISLVNTAYARWQTLDTLEYEYRDCHTNCHNSCHGSGSWR